jgi:uncharacterized repeat protein (TIGR01451 family)
VALTPLGQLRLEEQTLVLGDQGVIQPGDWGEAVFHGRADRGLGGPPIAAVKAELYDAEHGPDQGAALDWVWAAHRVDRGAPEGGQIELRSRVGARGVRLTGQAGDESGVREVTIELQGPNGIKTITCPVARPIEGRWSCDWAPEGELPDGSQVTVRLRATDITGQVGEWSAPRTVEIDALPPEVTVNEAASGVLRGGLVGGRSLTLYGTAVDPSGLSVVNACVADLAGSEACGTAQLLADGGWKYGTPDLGALDYVSRTLSISAEDTVGNRSTEPLSLTVRVDNVAPILTAGQVVSDVVLGRARRVLSGTIADGSVAAGGPAVDVSVRVDPPVGEAFRADTARDGSGWHYDLAGARTGLYTLWVDANDAAGNRSSAGPFQVEVTCAEAGVNAVALTAEPSLRGGNGLTLVTVIRNAGPDTIPAGLPFVLYGPADSTVPVTPTGTLTQTVVAIDTMTTTLALAAGETETFTVEWTTGALGQMNFYVAAAGEGTAYAGEAALCSRPEPVRFAAILADVPLYAGWNLISPPVEPLVPAVTAVQRPISGTYSAILGYDGGLQIYDALQPGAATLSTVRAGHGYWVHARSDGTSIPPGENWRATPAAMLHMAGQPVPEEHPLALAAGWNLAGYLPVASLPVTVALQGIEGDYASVLGWAGTAASYYPGLDARYNTLAMLRPSAGYWISVTRAITLEYPPALDWWETVPITATPTITQARALFGRLAMVRGAEQAAGVQPTYNWLNLYGSVYLPDGSPAPISTTVTALAGGVPCGATLVTDPGHFGLLACYGDDATTPRLIDGARSGDAITFLVNGLPAAARALGFNGQGVPPGQKLRWTAHGERWEVELGAPAVVDVAIAKSVTPGAAAAGAAISYTLAYSNAGSLPAQGVVITDTLPPEIIDPAFTKGGELTEAEGARTVTWHAGDLALGAGGTITVTGRLNPGLTPPLTVTNTAGISAPRDARPENNLTEAILQCIEAPVLKPVVWLPLIVHP